MKLYEMEGFLRGKCIPGDLKVNETNAEYLVRKFSEAEERCAELSARLSMINGLIEAAEQANKLAQEATETLVQERNALAAENAGLKSALNDILQPDAAVLERNHRVRALDAMESPATDAFLDEVRTQARNELITELESRFNEMTETLPVELRSGAAGAAAFVSAFRKGVAQ
ncbi:hypothetical protein NUC90_002008 [Salmonella enterica subsp. enterica serovar Montevideo]|uniref:Ead/Ea22-like family protein n=2 Tax=Salmonella enterica TaxID=28901 RepID=A0A5W4MX48_SALMO|nr:hypothetical protein [Salmonella enterica]EBP3752999.1 hypothetical protein [Salmonella enterica subsp. enterica]EDB2126191.1 hypothetical protein [Salmonella enterica subsp. enterica serovar Oranienburg]EDD0346942.1 hypothetical protein [Salmonella enterica subsp. enterica serovar Enteritidis]EHG6091913.1 hypothetical protein [Salmonella enterica subsp. enterica serovar Braenderup]QVC01429.1 hypothetical protein JYN43_15065 [Salmonella enterica subsp. enterica serovar Montevideo str. CFSAN